MFDDALELAENKLLILYVFNRLDLSISNNKITEIILENNLINYFTLQQYLSELTSSGFIKNTDQHKIIITEKGNRVLSMFIDRISEDKIESINNYLDSKLNSIKKEVNIMADYTLENKDTFLVRLKATENNFLLMDIKLSVNSNKEAKEICSKWKENSSELYSQILNILKSTNDN
ncbi:DUF4364 family protein [Clostridium botulinum]|uniref:DUF4364 family protein n=1 Tax=Clostridium botulinum TaxID=1491 RepID=UPI00174B9A25|nr:DUF4364 family protein [Clostridium botulinum]MBD5638963.1 DUF4364 family protein [Clostridium botulinum]